MGKVRAASIPADLEVPSESQAEAALANCQKFGMTLNGAKCLLARVDQGAMGRVASADTIRAIYEIVEED